MEKQPIDELLRRKLYDAEIVPSNAAWNTLQKRLGNGRIVPLLWYVSIAASLLLIVSFGRWMLTLQDETGTYTTVEQNIASAKRTKPPLETQRSVGIGKENKVMYTEVKYESAKLKGQTIHKTFKNQKIELTTFLQEPRSRSITTAPDFNLAKPGVNVEMVQTALHTKQLEAIALPTITKNLPETITLPSIERTLVVSIRAPADITPKLTQTITLVENNTSKNGLGVLFSKIKKIKDGDIFTASTIKMTKSNRRGLSKFCDDVKESIQNNTADE